MCFCVYMIVYKILKGSMRATTPLVRLIHCRSTLKLQAYTAKIYQLGLSQLQSTKQCVYKWITLLSYFSEGRKGPLEQVVLHIL